MLLTLLWCFHTGHLGEKEERDPGSSVYEFCMDPRVQGSNPIYSRLSFIWEEKHLVLR